MILETKCWVMEVCKEMFMTCSNVPLSKVFIHYNENYQFNYHSHLLG